ncbi:MAG: hypothetical protein IKY43_01095 [Bacteroidales bacterium]|nr:hypothetical protein [Bacteroidales bacterium]
MNSQEFIQLLVSVFTTLGLVTCLLICLSKKKDKKAIETFLEIENEPRNTRKGFFYEFISGAIFLIIATIVKGLMGDGITLRSIAYDIIIAAAFAIGLYIYNKLRKRK